MKLFLIVMFYLLPRSRCRLFELEDRKCSEILALPIQVTDTVIIDLDSNDELAFILKSCLLKEISRAMDQTTLIYKGHQFEQKLVETTNCPNVITVTKNLTYNLMDIIPVKKVARSHWSLLYIIVTNDKEFKCENGAMNQNDSKKIERIMNKLWHKLRLMYVGVIFPFACKGKIALYKGKIDKEDDSLYDRKITLIDIHAFRFKEMEKRSHELTHQYPLKASLFFRYPTTITECDNLQYYSKININSTGGYCGLDAQVMYDMVQHFQFNIDFNHDDRCDQYGYSDNGNITGSLGCITRGELDISFNSRFMVSYSNTFIYFLHYIKTDALCVVMKAAGDEPLWHYVYNVYTVFIWFLLALTTTIIGVLMWMFAILRKSEEKPNSALYFIGDSMMSIMCGIILRKKATITLLRAMCVICSIAFVAIYQSHVNHAFTTTREYESIKTLEDLYNSNLKLYTTLSVKGFMRPVSRDNEKQYRFLTGINLMTGNRLPFILSHPDSVTLGRKSDDTMEILASYTDSQGKASIHIMDECFTTFFLSYIARTGFPFVECIQRFLLRLNEAGLPNQYYSWTRRILDLSDDSPVVIIGAREFDKISLGDQRIAFTLLFLGYVGSFVIFLLEIWKHKRDMKTGIKNY